MMMEKKGELSLHQWIGRKVSFATSDRESKRREEEEKEVEKEEEDYDCPNGIRYEDDDENE